MSDWLNMGQHLKINAKKFPNTIALKDQDRAFSYPQTNIRVNRLANGLSSMGLKKKDRIAILMENAIEYIEIYLAAAKTGLVVVPLNFRLLGRDIEYIVNNSEAKAFIVHEEFTPTIDSIKSELYHIVPQNYIVVGNGTPGYQSYDRIIESSSDEEPKEEVSPKDTWIVMYTSGTTGKPKGVVRSHKSHIAFYLINAIDFGFSEKDICLNIMPLCHINTTFFSFIFTYIGATVFIHPARSFRAEKILEVIEQEKITFISLIPTHYNILLSSSDTAQKKDRSSIKKLLCSSAPVRKSMKKAIMDFFPGVDLYEAYGSTEAGIVTILKPYDQIRKLGAIGFETLGTDLIKVLDPDGNPVKVGEVGELFSKGPMLFDEYYKMPEKTKDAFNGGWFSAKDMARVDAEGYYYIVDRKDNMMITGGEHAYPTEIEELVGGHPDVYEVAVVGLPDEKWGDKVSAVVIKKPHSTLTETELIDWCRDKIAGYKRPKTVIFITPEEMPRTLTGKISHRKLKDRFK